MHPCQNSTFLKNWPMLFVKNIPACIYWMFLWLLWSWNWSGNFSLLVICLHARLKAFVKSIKLCKSQWWLPRWLIRLIFCNSCTFSYFLSLEGVSRTCSNLSATFVLHIIWQIIINISVPPYFKSWLGYSVCIASLSYNTTASQFCFHVWWYIML